MKRVFCVFAGFFLFWSLSLKAADPDSVALTRQYLSSAYKAYRHSDASATIRFSRMALDIASRQEDTEGKAFAHRYLAYGYSLQADKTNQIRHLLASLADFKSTFNSYEIAEATRLTGVYYLHLDPARMWELVNDAQRQFRLINHSRGLFECKSNMGQVYYEQGNFQRALTVFLMADRMADSLGFREGKAKNLARLSYAYAQIGDYHRQLSTLSTSLALYGDTIRADIRAQLLGDLAIAYRNQNDFIRSEHTFKRALRIADSLGSVFRQQELLQEISRLYLDWSKPDLAYRLLDSSYQIYTRIYNADLRDRLIESEARFEINRKEQENELLRERSARTNLIWILVTLAVGIIAVLAIMRFLTMRKHRAELQEQNTVITSQSEELRTLFQTLTTSELKYRALFDYSPLAILVLDSQGLIIDANETFCTESGYRKNELTGTPVSRFATPGNQKDVSRHLDRLRRGDMLSHETQRMNKDGSVSEVELNEVRVDLQDGSHLFLILSQDITDRKSSARALQTAMTAAEKANQVKTRFLSVISHEIRTPLNGIIGMSDLLVAGSLSEEQRDQVETIRSCGQDLFTLVNDVVDFSRLESGTIALATDAFRPAEMVTSVLHQVNPAGRSVPATVTIDEQIPDILIGDRTRFAQILTHLISNAYRFTTRGSISVGLQLAKSDGNWFWITGTVTDTGTGISPEQLSLLMQPLETGFSDPPADPGFPGLGLYITRHLIRLMNGTFTLTSEPGTGTTATFTIPFNSGTGMSVPPDEADGLEFDPTLASQYPMTILVAEDNRVNQKVLRQLLSKFGYTCSIAPDGARAVADLSEQDFDLVLMDIQMPVMDGFQATRLIRSTRKALPVIVALSAHILPEDREHLLSAGMHDCLPKPILVHDFRNLLLKWGPVISDIRATKGDPTN